MIPFIEDIELLDKNPEVEAKLRAYLDIHKEEPCNYIPLEKDILEYIGERLNFD